MRRFRERATIEQQPYYFDTVGQLSVATEACPMQTPVSRSKVRKRYWIASIQANSPTRTWSPA
jgi:hypothetical protein